MKQNKIFKIFVMLTIITTLKSTKIKTEISKCIKSKIKTIINSRINTKTDSIINNEDIKIDSTKSKEHIMLSDLKNAQDLSNLFPKSAKEIKNLTNQFIQETKDEIEQIINIPSKDKTFENTAKKLDHIANYSNLAILSHMVHLIEVTNTELEMIEAAHNAVLKITDFFIDNLSSNIKIYQAIKDYAQNGSKKETLSEEEQYFLQETINDYKKEGLDLEQKDLEKVKKLNKKLAKLNLEFESNLAKENKFLIFEKHELEGLDQDFINSLERTTAQYNGNITGNNETINNNNTERFILKIDYPSYFKAIENCKIEKTRETLYNAFSNRGYPVNKEILEQIIKKRAKLAKILGYENYASLDIDGQMAKNPETVKNFIKDIHKKARKKAKKEYNLLIKNLPSEISLVPLNSKNLDQNLNNQSLEHQNLANKKMQFKAWDLKYIKNLYKKQFLKIDEEEISQYFQTDRTIKELLSIYEDFLNLKFEIKECKDLWHPDLKLIEIYDNSNKEQPIGYLIADLYPRENKFTHACQMTIIPAIKEGGPSVAVILANFPNEIGPKPALMTRNDVETFFHELGHALHSILGRTKIASFSGTEVKMDFIEMPSQMFEEWIYDPVILQKISCHYKTGKPLPEQLIKKIIKTKNFESGQMIERQCYFAMLSLELFSKKGKVDIEKLSTKLEEKMLKNIYFGQSLHHYASFGHAADEQYGSKYYAYMWSKVFALDMFYEIKKYGLLNPEIGKKYRKTILEQGGSKDPNVLIKNFLGRETNSDAFFDDMGLK